MKKNRTVAAACIFIMAFAAGVNLVDYLLEAQEEGFTEPLMPPALAICFGSLAVSAYFREFKHTE